MEGSHESKTDRNQYLFGSEGEVQDPLAILKNEIRNDLFYEDLSRLSQGYEVIDPWGT